MKRMKNDELQELIQNYLDLKEKASESPEDLKNFKTYQNVCMEKLKYLVNRWVAKYKKFSNYPDLEQDGFEALLMSLESYKPEKGPFKCWADLYIKTKVSRAANAHSTIRVPIKKAKDLKPYKVNSVPEMDDESQNPFKDLHDQRNVNKINEAVASLSQEERDIINLTYRLNGHRSKTATNVIKTLNITRQKYSKLLNQAKKNLKKNIEV